MASSASRIPVIRNRSYQLNGLKSYAYALNKYTITPTQPGRFTRKDAQSKLMVEKADGSQGVVSASDQENDSFWSCPVSIGTPAQTVNLDFDSGSADLWVWSTSLSKTTQSAGTKEGIKIFDPTKSSTFKNTQGSTWKISYGDGSGASGSVGTDNVTIGGITIKNQTVELASQVSSEFQTESSSGLLGLAFGSINTVQPTPAKTPVENMIAQSDIPSTAELFTVYLADVKESGSQSFYTFGEIDQSVVTASNQQISYTPIDNSQGFWMFSSESGTVNGKTIQLSGNKAIADTGTTLMLVSDEFVSAVYAAIPGSKNDSSAGGWTIPSGNVDQRPVITVAIGNKQITIEKEQLGWSDLGDGSNMVFGAIQSRGTNPFDILGDAFLVNVYAIFDVGNTQFGVVQRPDSTSAGSTTTGTTTGTTGSTTGASGSTTGTTPASGTHSSHHHHHHKHHEHKQE